ncbi:MAG: sigma-70 family RNA polymerase sigma factor [Caldilineaceae bacterium]|nr:sigma-70 family RNA polymerase sigma factor [Caldilineaceae bacterium]
MESYETLVTTSRSTERSQTERHAAFAQLVAHFGTMAFAYAQQMVHDEQLAQDITQEAFLTAYQRLAQLREPAAFPGWLRRIVHTKCHRALRVKRPAIVPIECVATMETADGDLAQQIADADTAQTIVDCVMGAIAGLPEHERSVVRLFYFDGYSIRDVAAALDLPITTIKKRLQYARDRLRKQLLDQYQKGNLPVQTGCVSHWRDCTGQIKRSSFAILPQWDTPLQTWTLQAGQWLLPLFAVLSPEPVLCPV